MATPRVHELRIGLSMGTYGSGQGVLTAVVNANAIMMKFGRLPGAILVRSGICKRALGHLPYAVGVVMRDGINAIVRSRLQLLLCFKLLLLLTTHVPW